MHDLVAVGEVREGKGELVLREVGHARHRLAVEADPDARPASAIAAAFLNAINPPVS